MALEETRKKLLKKKNDYVEKTMISNAPGAIYDSINSEADIEKLIAGYDSESLHLDFKEALKGPSDDFLNGFSKAISGFSNADGGVLIYGISEHKNVSQRFNLAPTELYSAYDQKIQEMISRLTAPPNSKVVLKQILSEKYSGKGYIVVLIPKSDIAPHQVVSSKKYYQRAGESHTEMHHYQIADLFGKRLSPELIIFGNLERDLSNHQNVFFKLFVKNNGKAIAKFPFVLIKGFDGFKKLSHFTSWFTDPVHAQKDNFYTVSTDKVIHHDIDVPLVGYSFIGNPNRTNFVEIKGLIGCDGMATREFKLEISEFDIDARRSLRAPNKVIYEK